MHELAHQWVGDHVSVATWRDIWLNEGFATYAEWLWAERAGAGDGRSSASTRPSRELPASSAFWDVKIGDPGPDDSSTRRSTSAAR